MDRIKEVRNIITFESLIPVVDPTNCPAMRNPLMGATASYGHRHIRVSPGLPVKA